MEIPPGIASNKTHQVCRLMKSLYGLKQASKCWYDKLTSFLYSIKFTRSKAGNSLFVRNTEGSFIALLVYVDDILIAGNNANEINIVKGSLDAAFKIKDLGHLKFFPGLEIAMTGEGIHICQCKYALEILADAVMLSAEPTTTPMVQKNEKLFDGNTEVHDMFLYRRIIRRLLYLVNTRPYISFAVQFLSQFVESSTKAHHQAAQRILRYIKASPTQGLFYPKNTNLQIKAFSVQTGRHALQHDVPPQDSVFSLENP